MPSEHFIPGKDASLEASIARMQSQLAQIGFRVEERHWLNPVDAVWSVHLVDRDCPLLYTNGKGRSRLAARASALGEFFERLATNHFWSHYDLGKRLAAADFTHYPDERWFPLSEDGAWPEALLTPELQSFYNPEGRIAAQTLVDFNSGNAARGLCALPFTRLGDGARVWFPVNILANLYVSNGLAAGNSEAEARTQALSEIIERHVKFRVIGEALCLPEIPPEHIERQPGIASALRELRAAGFGIRVRDASLGGRYPVVNISLLNPSDQGVYASFGAHPRFPVALERTLSELLQGRALDALGGFPEPVLDLAEIGSTPNLESHFIDSSGILHWNFFRDTPDFAFCDWNFSDSTAADYAWLLAALHAEGHEVFVADYPQLGVYACRIIVPGLSEIYPIDDLEFENNSLGTAFRAAVLRLPELNDEECAGLLDRLNGSGIDEQRLVAALIGLAPDPGSPWEDMRIGELKTLLALATGDVEAVREGCEWIRHFGQIPAKRRPLYRGLEQLRGLIDAHGDEEAYRSALAELYGQATLAEAQALLARQRRFPGFIAPGTQAIGQTHGQLLAAYDKVRRQRAAYA